MQREQIDQATDHSIQEFLQNPRHAKRVVEAVEQKQLALGEARRWQEVLEKCDDENSRQYFEGLVKLCTLKAFHHHVIAQLHSGNAVVRGLTPDRRTVHDSSKVPPDAALIEKCRNKALTEYNDHHVKSEAFLMLARRYRALGLERQVHTYEERATLEKATTRGFQTVVEAYDRKLEGLGRSTISREEAPCLETNYLSLLRAERHLEDYNASYSKSWENTLQAFEKTGDRRDTSVRLAEKQALNAASSYEKYRSEIQSAEKAYDVLSREMTGAPLELAKFAQNGPPAPEPPLESHENPELQADRPELSNPGRRMNRLATGVVVYQTLKVLDHEL